LSPFFVGLSIPDAQFQSTSTSIVTGWPAPSRSSSVGSALHRSTET
jgi:hypothetical protein